MAKVSLYLESATDYSITMVSRDRGVKIITADEARRLWNAGRVEDYNLSMKRLAHCNFDVEVVKAHYAAKHPQG